jgi:hypothetical protein
MTAQRFGNWCRFRNAVPLFGKPGDGRSPAALQSECDLGCNGLTTTSKSGKLTASEFQRTSLNIQRKVFQIHWAAGFNCQAANTERTELGKENPETRRKL